ncbi:MAG: hypothetical protein AAF502_02780 [Bacteroidota bacterium]
MKYLLFVICICLIGFGCDRTEVPPGTEPVLKIKLQFDPIQERLDNLGNPSIIPAGNAAQTPSFRSMSTHYIELVPNELTQYKSGQALYSGAEVATSAANPHSFTTAIDFDNAIVKGENEVFFEIPIKDLAPGTYRHLRVSVSYQNYDVVYNLVNIPGGLPDLNGESGTIASFLGYFMRLNDITIRNMSTTVDNDVLQGYWAFETNLSAPWENFNQLSSGQAPEGATTVVNPFPTAIPPGSCVVSGDLDNELVITGDETADISLTLSFSINNSFEWEDDNGNGQLDLDIGNGTMESVVDMGLRGLIGIVE